MLIGQYIRCFTGQFLKDEFQLFKPPVIDGFGKTASYTIFRSNAVTSEIIFVKDLNNMMSRDMLFKVKKN